MAAARERRLPACELAERLIHGGLERGTARQLEEMAPPECAAALREHYARRMERPVPLSPTRRDADLVFAQPDGSPLSPDMITDGFERLVAAAGVTRITFHRLRHTHATLSHLAGANVRAVSARLGHSSIQITLDTYAHVLPQMEDQAADAIGGMLWAG
jgi:integrase